MGDADLLMWFLLPVWVVLVAPPLGSKHRELSAAEVGFLRRGRRAAFRTALAELYLEDLIEVRRSGQVVRGRAHMPSGMDPTARAVYAAMPTPVRPAVLAGRPKVRRAVAELVGRLAAAGLCPGRVRWAVSRMVLVAMAAAVAGVVYDEGLDRLHAIELAAVVAAWFIPRRTVAGQRRLLGLRQAYAGVVLQPPDGDQTERSGSPDGAVACGLGTAVVPELKDAFRRRRRARPPDDYGSERDYDGSWIPGTGGGV